MSKIFKFIFVIAITFFILLNDNYSFAAVDMNISSNSTTNTTTSGSMSTSVTTLGSSSFDLQLNNVLNVCIIVIGVLLILLGIAILIRLKQ